jgi:hypothetical protein
MNAYQGRGVREVQPEQGTTHSEYEIILKLSVNDPGLLRQAVGQLLRDKGLGTEDIDDTIGPVDDPSIIDCLAALVMPDVVEGCRIEAFDIHSGARPAPIQKRSEIVAQDRPPPPRPRPFDETADDAGWRAGLDAPTIRVSGSLTSPGRIPGLPN